MTDAIDDLLKMQDEMRAKNPPRTTIPPKSTKK
jgi:hypothetical protein